MTGSKNNTRIGRYGVTYDENGKPRISFDKAEDKFNDNGNEPEKETVTANTDKVDREIINLRNIAQMLSQKLRSADEGTATDIQQELEQVNAELTQKDKDEYCRQNTVFT